MNGDAASFHRPPPPRPPRPPSNPLGVLGLAHNNCAMEGGGPVPEAPSARFVVDSEGVVTDTLAPSAGQAAKPAWAQQGLDELGGNKGDIPKYCRGEQRGHP